MESGGTSQFLAVSFVIFAYIKYIAAVGVEGRGEMFNVYTRLKVIYCCLMGKREVKRERGMKKSLLVGIKVEAGLRT